MISLSAFIALLMGLGVYFFSRRAGIKKIAFTFALLFLIISTFSFVFSGKQRKEITDKDTAIIFSPSVVVKGSPDESGTDLFLLHEGTKVGVVDSLENWREIKLVDGSKGWIKSSDMEVI